MDYLLTNQNNFSHIPYPCRSYPKATVKSGGCGACAALMMVENLTDKRYLMKDWIKWVMSVGGRVDGGTDMGVLSKAMAKEFEFTISTTDSESLLIEHVKKGGLAIAHVGGAYGDWKGLFSTNGHYIAVLGYADGMLVIGDPDYRIGKYTSGGLGKWRSQYVEVEDGLVYVKPDVLNLDTANRSPNYYLFNTMEEKKDMGIYVTFDDIPKWAKPTIQKLLDKGFLHGEGNGMLNLTETALKVFVVNDRAGLYEGGMKDEN